MGTMVAFQIEHKTMVVPVNDVRCALLAVAPIVVPGQNDKLLGVITLEETVIPIINLRTILGLPQREIELQDQILVLESKLGPLGVFADSVHGVLQFTPNQYTGIDGSAQSFASGLVQVEDDLYTVLDPSKLVSRQDLLIVPQSLGDALP